MKIRTLGKKALALTVCLAVLLSCLIISGISASAVTVWDGTTALPKDADSDGFCEIYTAAELAWVAQTDTTSKFILMNDIYINDLKVEGETITKLDGSAVDTAALKTWVSNKTFKGVFDGNGYTVSGIYNASAAQNAATDNRGLFGQVLNGTIKNLRVSNTYLKDGFFTGAVFGSIRNQGSATLENIYVDNAYLSTTATGNYPAVGGLFGYVQEGTISVSNVAVVDTYLNNTAEASRVGAFWGDSWNCRGATVTNSYSALTSHNPWGLGRGVAAAGGQGSYLAECFTSNVYAANVADAGAAKLAASQVAVNLLKGENAAVAVAGLGKAFYTTAGYPIQGIFLDSIDPAVNKQLKPPFEGAGTAAEPYVIETAEQLILAVETFGSGMYYKLANDIYLNDIDKINWETGEVADGYTPTAWYEYNSTGGDKYITPKGTGTFSGHIDGNGYAVHGLFYPYGTKTTAAGLLPAAANASVKNLAIKNSFIAGGRWTGGIIGYSYNNVVVDNCLIDESTTINGYDAGGTYYTAASWNAEQNKVITPYMGNPEKDVNFESEACGGIVGYANKNFTATNNAVYATLSVECPGLTYTNPLINGGNPVAFGKGGHINAIVGTAWNSRVTMSGNVSVLRPHDNISGAAGQFTTTCENNYAQAIQDGKTCCNVVTAEQMTGANALTNMSGLDTSVWTKTNGYPLPKVFTCLNNRAHDWSDWAETTKPDCDVDGEESRTCGVCGDTETQPITAPGHDDATEWTSDANGHWHACANCTDKLGYAAHTYDQQVENDEYSAGIADCTQPAKFYYSCVCGAKGTTTFDSGSSMGHSPKTEWTSDADKHWHECNNCTDKLDEAAHVFDKEVVADEYLDTPADCHNPAKYFKSCVCGVKGTETFVSGNANDHAPKTEWVSDTDKHWHECNNCTDKLDEAAHVFDKEVVADEYLDTPADCHNPAKYFKSCVCGAMGTETFSYGEPLNEDEEPPVTGDTFNPFIWIVALLLSGSVFFFAVCYRRKHRA